MALTLGTYQLAETLGTSALGTTYVGHRQQSTIIVKVLELASQHSTAEQRLAINEFQSRVQGIAALYHPGIVPVRDYGVAGSYLYTVSGFLPAGSLVDPEAQKLLIPPFAHEIVADMTAQIAEALIEAHRAGVPHGNLKPSNCFISGRNGDKVKLQIGDFALISEHRNLLQPPTAVGRFIQPDWSFTAPEQRNSKPTAAGDQFALATMIRFWLTGNPPGVGGNLPQSYGGTALDSHVEAVLNRAMLAARDARYTSIATFARTLIAALEGRSTVELAAITALPDNSFNGSLWVSSANLAAVTPGSGLPSTDNSALDNQTRPVPPDPSEQVVPLQPAPSAWLVAGPTTSSMPPNPPSLVMRSSEELYGIVPSGTSTGSHIVPQVQEKRGRRPTTREEELVAPPASRLAVGQRAPKKPSSSSSQQAARRRAATSNREPNVLDQLNIPLPRREVLVWAGRVAIIAGVGAGGVVAAGGIVNGVRSLLSRISSQPKTTTQSIKVPVPIILNGQAGSITALAWSPDGSRLAAGSADDAVIRLWDINHPEAPITQLTSPDFAKGIATLSWARDSRYLLIGPVAFGVEIWSIYQQAAIAHLAYELAIGRWHPNQDIAAFVTAVTDPAAKSVLIWETSSASLLNTLKGFGDVVTTIDWAGSNDLTLAVGAKDASLSIWQGKTGKDLAKVIDLPGHKASITGVSWERSGNRLVSGSSDGTALLWSGTQAVTLQKGTVPITAVSWSPSSSIIAVAAESGQLTLWDADAHQLLATIAGTAKITTLTWSADGHRLVVGTDDKHVLVYKLIA